MIIIMITLFQDVTLAAACAPPGGGRNNVTPRFIRHFGMLTIPSPSEHSLKHMFMVRLGYTFQTVFIEKLNH